MKQYQGIRMTPGYKAVVFVNGEELDMKPSKLFVHDYDADCLEWGYFGSGPSQTAAAILYDATKDVEISKKFHQDFKRDFIAHYDQDAGFKILDIEIQLWLDKMIQLEGGQQ